MGLVVPVANRLAGRRIAFMRTSGSLRTRLSRPRSAAPLRQDPVHRAQICRAAEGDDTRRGLATFGPRFG
jgi:hypothetical protein